jgi:uncharacterized membrane protein
VKAETLISWLLRIGVGISATLAIIGMIVIIVHHPAHVTGMPMHNLREIFASIDAGHGQGIAMLGLLLLIATPVMRVALSIGLFLRERDYTFVLITTTVLLLLILSFALGAAGA